MSATEACRAPLIGWPGSFRGGADSRAARSTGGAPPLQLLLSVGEAVDEAGRVMSQQPAATNGASAVGADVGPPTGPPTGAAARAGVVGRVVGTEDSTPLEFSVALDAGAYLQLDDVVVTARQVPGVGAVTVSGVVTQVRARHERASFGSGVFLI